MLGPSAGNSFESSLGGGRRESRKRRRVSERRRVFSRIGSGKRNQTVNLNTDSSLDSPDYCFGSSQRSESPLGGGSGKISMKIQFHITVAPEHEPLILDTNHVYKETRTTNANTLEATTTPTSPPEPIIFDTKKSSIDSSIPIGEQIQACLMRQSSSTRRRKQLFALHNQSVQSSLDVDGEKVQSENNIAIDTLATTTKQSARMSTSGATGGRESGARSSTITGGMQDEATMKFLAKHQAHPRPELQQATGAATGTRRFISASSNSLAQAATTPTTTPPICINDNSIATTAKQQQQQPREHIYFKRDGQRFGHEFTLKLAVDKNYRCLLKVRPLIPLQAISIQGHQVSFVDLSASVGGPQSSLTSSAPTSSISLNRDAWHSLGGLPTAAGDSTAYVRKSTNQNGHVNSLLNSGTSSNIDASRRAFQGNNSNLYDPHHRLSFAQPTTSNRNNSDAIDYSSPGHHSISLSTASSLHLQQQLLKQQQRQQMMRHFAASHCTPSNSHLGGQLIYMFDWSARRFEVKFYEPEQRQHLNWGSQLHFIDYDCNINTMGQINVDRVQYY